MGATEDMQFFKGYRSRSYVFSMKYIEKNERPVRAGNPREVRVGRNNKLGAKTHKAVF